MTREAGVRLAPAASARRYLYELLTGCALATAPPPYRLSPGSLGSYNDFALGMPASLAAALAGHARRLLGGWEIGREPLQWQPPDDWVTVTTWPGADPSRTDPAPIHRALLNDETPPAQIAADLGISLGHLRQVLRRHPLPRPRRPVRRTLIPAREPATRPPGQQSGVIYLDPAWLRREYLTWHRSLDDIAAHVGCTIQILNRFARDHGIPVRSRGTSAYMLASSASGIHPRDLPEPLRSALVGPHARQRLDHLLIIAGHASIRQAARALGRWPSALYDQLSRTERACGGPLVNRSRRPPGTGILTPLGEQLCQQARDYPQSAEPGPGHACSRPERPNHGALSAADDRQRALLRRWRLEVIEVEGRELRADREVVAVSRCPGSDTPEHRRSVGRQVHRLGHHAQRPQQLAVLLPHDAGPEREVHDHVRPVAHELHQAGAQHVLDVAVHLGRQGHRGDAARPRLLVKGQPGHALLLVSPRNCGLSRSGRTAHEDHPPHESPP
jgi:hypothetical protein